MGESIKLTVANGEINQSGIARIPTSIYNELGLDEDNQDIDITYNDKTIMRKAFADEFVDRNSIFLRKNARDDLELKEGEKVVISRHKTIGEEAKKDYVESKEKVKKKVKSDEEKEEK